MGVALDPNWIKARDVLEVLSSDGNNPNAAIEALATHLRFGKLRAQAKQIWISEEPTLAQAWKVRPEVEKPEVLADVPVRYWRVDINWAQDVALWRWPSNVFFTTLRLKPPRRRIIRGVRLSHADLAKLFPYRFGGAKRKGKRGPDMDVAGRDLVWLELLQMALDGKFSGTQGKLGKTELGDDLYDTLNGEGRASGIGRNRIAEIVSMAHRKLY